MQEMVRLNIPINVNLHKELKRAALEADVKMSEYVRIAIAEKIEKDKETTK